MQDAPTMLSLDPGEVDYALSWAVGIKGFAANAARTTKANVAAHGARWKPGRCGGRRWNRHC